MKKKPTKRAAAKRPGARAKIQSAVRSALNKAAKGFKALLVPALGEVWPGQGGRFAGICKGAEGKPDHLLIFADLGVSANHADALKRAKAYTADGHKDFDAAELQEGALCYATSKAHFQRDWYWLKPPAAIDPAYAWFQSFNYGFQPWGHESNGDRVFAVRRIPIQ
jgi:hypothetical protein